MTAAAQEAVRTRALIESNTREATDLVAQLTLLLEQMGSEQKNLDAARMVARRLSDRLAQAGTLERLGAGGGWRPDGWSPIELIEELEHEALALSAGRIDVRVVAPDLVPQFWFFDRELVATALSGALHAALCHAEQWISLEFGMRDGYLGFSIGDDAGAFPAVLIENQPAYFDRGECNGNALGVHFARIVAGMHVDKARQGHVELRNRPYSAGTRFTLWLP
jgi:signal transduction histidine kinase